MSVNNPLIYNSVINGIAGGISRMLKNDTSPLVFNNSNQIIGKIAAGVDANIPTINGGCRPYQASLIELICNGMFHGTWPTDINSNVEPIINNIVTQYNSQASLHIDIPNVIGENTQINIPEHLTEAPFLESGNPKLCRIEGWTANASQTLQVLNYEGSGYINHILMSISSSDTVGRNQTRLQVYIDDESTPSIDVPICDISCSRGMEAVGGADGACAQYMAKYTGYTSLAFNAGISFYIYINIPFTTRVKVRFVNASTTQPIILGGYIEYRSRANSQWGRYKHLYAKTVNTTLIPYEEQSLLNIINGRGVFYGGYLYFVSGDANYDVHEGNVKYYLNGESEPTINYDCTEGWVNKSWYYWQDKNTRITYTNHSGCTRKNDSNIVGLYRWHRQDPIEFNEGFKFTWSAGQEGATPVNSNTSLYGVLWYYLDS